MLPLPSGVGTINTTLAPVASVVSTATGSGRDAGMCGAGSAGDGGGVFYQVRVVPASSSSIGLVLVNATSVFGFMGAGQLSLNQGGTSVSFTADIPIL